MLRPGYDKNGESLLVHVVGNLEPGNVVVEPAVGDQSVQLPVLVLAPAPVVGHDVVLESIPSHNNGTRSQQEILLFTAKLKKNPEVKCQNC